MLGKRLVACPVAQFPARLPTCVCVTVLLYSRMHKRMDAEVFIHARVSSLQK